MKTKYIIAMAAATLMLAGCSRNDLGVESYGSGDGLLKFRVAGAGVKGALINNEEQMLAARIDKFMVESWNEDCSKFVQLQKVSYDKEAAEWQTEKPIEWKGEDEKTFFAYANLPASGAATVENTCTSGSSAVRKQTLKYTLPLDAREQNDIMLGWYGGDGNGKTTATVTFVHPLSSIRLVRGAMNVDAIKSITISGLYESGTVDVTYTMGAEDKVVPNYSWGDSRTGSVESKLEPDNGKSFLEIAEDGTIGTPFIIIPQDGVSAVKVTVNALLDGEEKVLSVKFPTSVTKLEAGKTYELTLGYGAFTFALDNPADAILSFNNTTEASAKEIELTSTLSMSGATPTFADWDISRVIIGTSDAVQVTGNSWSGNGITIEKAGTGSDAAELQITAAERTLEEAPCSNGYWRNTSSRTDFLGWSPADWTTETSSSPIDLSKFDFETDTKNAHAMTTANCYIIRHAGTYKLPLVYGNAIVDGAFNEQSYYPNCKGDVTGGSKRLERFQNHLGNGIISPFIEYNTTDGSAKSESNSYLVPANYQIVWQDKADIITIGGISKESVTVKNAAGTSQTYNVSYITFTIPQDKICQNNAIIAVKDGDRIMWSWHIWTTNDPTLLSGPKAVWNNSIPSVEYDFFPLYNLGWIDEECYPAREDVKIVLAQQKSGREIEITVRQNSVLNAKSYGCSYQWGRKDPLCTTDSPAQGIFTHGNNSESSLAGSILNPGTMYTRGEQYYDWCGEHYNNLWTGKKSAVGQFDQDADMIKTIYDPSPVGYKIPAPNAFTGFTTTGGESKDDVATRNVKGEFSSGWNFYTKSKGQGNTVFFPKMPFRDFQDGSVLDNDTYVYYWSAVPGTDVCGYNLCFSANYVHPVYHGGYRAYGFLVRPVKE